MDTTTRKTLTLRREVEKVLNSASAENGSDTPDFILAEYLTDCLAAFDKAVTRRTKWYEPEPEVNMGTVAPRG